MDAMGLYQVVGLALGIALGFLVLILFVFFSTRMQQVKLWWLQKLSPLKNWGTVDVLAPGRVYTFLVSYNEDKWELFKNSDTKRTFTNPSKSDKDYDAIRTRWGVPFCSFDFKDGVHPLKLVAPVLPAGTVENENVIRVLTRGADPAAVNNLLMQQKGLADAKEDQNLKKGNQLLFIVCAIAALGAVVAAYYGYSNAGAIGACVGGAVKPAVAAAAPALGGILSP